MKFILTLAFALIVAPLFATTNELVFLWNSLGVNPTFAQAPPEQVILPNGNWGIINCSQSGYDSWQMHQDLNANYSLFHNSNPSATTILVFINEIGNSIAHGSNDIWSVYSISNCCRAIVNYGISNNINFIIISGSAWQRHDLSGTSDTYRVSADEIWRTNFLQAFPNGYFVNFATNLLLNYDNHPEMYQSDGIHESVTGALVVWTNMQPTLNQAFSNIVINGTASAVITPSSAQYHVEMGQQPASGSVQNLNPPPFTWLYYENTNDFMGSYTDPRVFLLQLTTNNNWGNLYYNTFTSNNFYNFNAAITNSDGTPWTGTCTWRVAYSNLLTGAFTGFSPTNTFTLSSGALNVDRSFLTNQTYLTSSEFTQHPHLFFNLSNRDALSKFLRTNNWRNVVGSATDWLTYSNQAISDLSQSWWNSSSVTNVNDWWEMNDLAVAGLVYQASTNAAISNANPGLMMEIFATNWVRYGYDQFDPYTYAVMPQYLALAYDWLYPLMTTQQRSNVLYALESSAMCDVYYSWLYTATTLNTGMPRTYTNTLAVGNNSQFREGNSHSRNGQIGLMPCMAALGESPTMRGLLPFFGGYYYSQFDPFQGDDGRAYNGVQNFDTFRQFGPYIAACCSFPEWGLTNVPIYTNLNTIFSFLDPVSYGNDTELEKYCWGVQGGSPATYFGQFAYTRMYQAACLFNSGATMRQYNRSKGSNPASDNPLVECFTPFFFPPPAEADAPTNSFFDPVHGWLFAFQKLPSDYDVYTNGVGIIVQAPPSGAGNGNASINAGQVEMFAYGAHVTQGGSGNYEEHPIFQNNGLFVDGIGANNQTPPMNEPPLLSQFLMLTNTGHCIFFKIDLTKAFNLSNYTNNGYQSIVRGYYGFPTNARPYISSVIRSGALLDNKCLVLYDEFTTTTNAHFQWKWNCWSNAIVNTNNCSFVYSPTNALGTNITVYVQHVVNPALMTLTNLASPAGHVYGTNLDNYAKVNPYTGENYNGAGDPQGPSTPGCTSCDSVWPYWQDTIWIQNTTATTNWHFMTVIYPAAPGETAPTITRYSDNTVGISNAAMNEVVSGGEILPSTTIFFPTGNTALPPPSGGGGGNPSPSSAGKHMRFLKVR